MKSTSKIAGAILLSFCAGFFAHFLYLRWHRAMPGDLRIPAATDLGYDVNPGEPQSHAVTFVPTVPSPREKSADLPVLAARDVEKIRALTGHQARIRGRVFRVGHSAKSNTYFLNFGPSREALTAVIFASAVELFEKAKIQPQSFENREVEIRGWIKDHPQYGLEVVIEQPAQIRALN